MMMICLYYNLTHYDDILCPGQIGPNIAYHNRACYVDINTDIIHYDIRHYTLM